MPQAVRCCSYTRARQGLLITNFIDFVFCIVFIGVGAVSLIYAQSFARATKDYCIKECARTDNAETVGCDCESDPATTTIPSLVFQSPSIGLITVGVFSFFKVLLGLCAVIRRSQGLVIAYICMLVCIILLQIVFGAAGAAVSLSNSPDIEGPLFGALNSGDPPKYKLFDWKSLDSFFSEGCYAGEYTQMDEELGIEHVYNHPLCTFEGRCNRAGTEEEQRCCNEDFNCDHSPTCISGSRCLGQFFNKVGAPVAVAAFLSLVVQIMALCFACAVRTGSDGGVKDIPMREL